MAGDADISVYLADGVDQETFEARLYEKLGKSTKDSRYLCQRAEKYCSSVNAGKLSVLLCDRSFIPVRAVSGSICRDGFSALCAVFASIVMNRANSA